MSAEQPPHPECPDCGEKIQTIQHERIAALGVVIGMTRDALPNGVTAHKRRLFFASMRQHGTNWALHVFAALGFRPAAKRLRERYVREWLEENEDIVEVKR